MAQDNETFQVRVRRAVTDAVFEAGRAHPDAPDINFDVNAALTGICEAMAMVAATIGQLPEDREEGAKLLESMEEFMGTQIRFFAEKLRSGELSKTPPDRPKPRLVK